MELELTGRRALITGASRGIGAAISVCLASEGCDVTLVARTTEDLQAVATKISDGSNVSVSTVVADLSVGENIDRVLADAGQVDILVNNAGAIPSGSIEDIDESSWREAWDLKVFGYINLMRRVFKGMEKQGGGVIVNVIGVAGERPNSNYVAGCAGNAALMAVTRALGARSIENGVRVVGVNPGLIATDRMVTLLRSQAENRFGDGERWTELIDPRLPPGKPEHIADIVAFLASDRSSNTSGTVVTVDGGSSAR